MFLKQTPRENEKKNEQKKTISNSSRWIFNKLHNYSKLKSIENVPELFVPEHIHTFFLLFLLVLVRPGISW